MMLVSKEIQKKNKEAQKKRVEAHIGGIGGKHHKDAEIRKNKES